MAVAHGGPFPTERGGDNSPQSDCYLAGDRHRCAYGQSRRRVGVAGTVHSVECARIRSGNDVSTTRWRAISLTETAGIQSRRSDLGPSTLSPIPRARERARRRSGTLSANQHPVVRIPRRLREAGNDRWETGQVQPQTRWIHLWSVSCPPSRTTVTGTCADRTTVEVTEPKCIPAYPPRPPLPRTTSWALRDSSTSQRSGTSQTSRRCTCTSG